jgi:hypothetical protein
VPVTGAERGDELLAPELLAGELAPGSGLSEVMGGGYTSS